MARLMMLHFLIKGRPAVDLQRIKERVKKILAKSLTCRSLDVHVPVSCPREYEFSCSNTPIRHVTTRSKNKRHYPCSFYYYSHHPHPHALHKTRVHHALLDGSPGMSPLGYWQVGLDDGEINSQPLMGYVDADDHHDCDSVDRAAEEFIERFHKELRLQKLYFPS